MDGLIPDAYLHPDAHGLKIPTLRAISQNGAVSDGVSSAFPTLTYPSHTSMITGVWPAKHGIYTNRSFDPLETDLEGWRWYAEDIQRDTLWQIAERAGYRVALIHWPVSVGAKVTWRVPEYWRAKNDQDKKVLRAVSTPGLLEAVGREYPDFWARYQPPAARDDALTDIALHVLVSQKPELLLLHLVEVDGAQHRSGLWTKESLTAIENDDRQLARIREAIDRAGLAADTVLMVVSDHGFLNSPKMVKPCTLLRDAGLVQVKADKVTDWKVTTIVNSGSAYFYLRDPADTASERRLHGILAGQSKQADGGIGRVYEREEIRARGGDPAAVLAIEASSGYQLGGGCTGEYRAAPAYLATHGYDPSRPELRASLLVSGPTIAHGTISGARLIDIGPTVASLLGLAMPEIDGAPLRITPVRSEP